MPVVVDVSLGETAWLAGTDRGMLFVEEVGLGFAVASAAVVFFFWGLVFEGLGVCTNLVKDITYR